MARVPGREPYRVRLHPHGVPGAPGGPAGAVRLGTSCRSSSSGQAFPLSCCRESPGPQDGRAWHVESLGCTHSRRAATRAGSPGQRPAPQRRRTSGGMLAQSRAGMTAGWAAGTAPPACPRQRATRCRQVTPGPGTTRAPRTRARRRCPGPPGPAGPRRSAGPGWPGWPTRRTGRRRSRARSAR